MVADPFHVIQDANRRVDEARRVEQDLCRWPLLKNQEELTPKQAGPSGPSTVAQFHWAKEQLPAFYRAPQPRPGSDPPGPPAVLFLQHAEDAELVRWGRTLRSWKAGSGATTSTASPAPTPRASTLRLSSLKRLSYGFRNRHMNVRKMLLGLVPLAVLLSPPHLLTWSRLPLDIARAEA